MPGIIRPPPRGILRPNQAAIGRGLSFAQAFQNGPSVPWMTRGTIATRSYAGGGYQGVLRGGVGLTNSGGYWGASSAGNTYSVSTVAGTVIIAFVADHDSGSGVTRLLLTLGNATFPTTPGVAFSNFFGTWYVGWADGTDKRITVSATGLYADGEVTTAGLTWDGSGQTAYMKGAVIGTGAAATYGSTAGANFVIGENYPAGTYPWISSTRGGILYMLIFDRALSPSEMAQANADLWWWCQQQQRARSGVSNLSAEITGTVDITATLAAEMALAASITGTVGVTASIAAALELAATLAGTVPITASLAAGLDLAAIINGTVPITASIIAQLERLAQISGTIPITASLTATNGVVALDTHDGWVKRSRRERRLDALRARRDEERLADAQALRAALEAALGGTEAIPAPKVVQAVQAAPKPAEVDWRRIAERDEDYARLSRTVARLTALVDAEAKRRADDDDDEEAMFLMGAA